MSSATEQLTAALSQADDLETLFTDPGYRPVGERKQRRERGCFGGHVFGDERGPGGGGDGRGAWCGAHGSGRARREGVLAALSAELPVDLA